MAPARTAFAIWSVEECLEGHKSAWYMSPEAQDNDLNELEPSLEYWDARNPPPNLHIAIDDTMVQEWIEGYKADQAFSSIWSDEKREIQNWKANGRFIHFSHPF